MRMRMHRCMYVCLRVCMYVCMYDHLVIRPTHLPPPLDTAGSRVRWGVEISPTPTRSHDQWAGCG